MNLPAVLFIENN